MTPLRWKSAKIPIALSTSLIKQSPNIKGDSDTFDAIRRSLDTWERAANIEFDVTWTDLQTLSPAGNSGDGISLVTIAQTPENLSLFGGESDDVSARTRVFFTRKGFISEADIVLNPYQQFSTDGSIGTFDLEATFTHEIGHLLGLEHSLVSSATMYARQGKNGFLSLPSYTARTLAEDDIAGIRSLYGTKDTSEDCCGKIQGRLVRSNGKLAKDSQVWVEELETGRLVSSVLTNLDGSFHLDGLQTGVYRIYSQYAATKKEFFSAEEIGEVEVKNGKTINIIKKLKNSPSDFNLQFAGFNGLLSDLAIPLNGGKSYVLYVGGKNLDAKSVKIAFNSPFVTVVADTIAKQDFGSDISVLSFEVKLKTQIPTGEYSFMVQKQNGENQFIIGAITIEKFLNPWSSFEANEAN
jgi:hypothetical protein